MDTAYHSRVAKVSRDVAASEHKKKQKCLSKQVKVFTKSFVKEEQKVRDQLERLEIDKKSMMNLTSMSRVDMSQASRRRLSMQNDSQEVTPRVDDTRSRVMDYGNMQARSMRRLSQAPTFTIGSSHQLPRMASKLSPGVSQHILAPSLSDRVSSFISGKQNVPTIFVDDIEDTDEEDDIIIPPKAEKKKVTKKTKGKKAKEDTSPSLFDFAIKTVENMDAELFTQEDEDPIKKTSAERGGSMANISTSGQPSSSSGKPLSSRVMDLSVLKQLEHMLKEQYVDRRSSMDMSSGSSSSTNRAQKKRLQYLDQILHTLRSGNKTSPNFDPEAILKCSYLRLSRSNVQTLENIIRESGKDPGIHAHTAIEDIAVWDKSYQKPHERTSQQRRSIAPTQSVSTSPRVPKTKSSVRKPSLQ